jgi:Rieske Fe-S protein
MTWQKDTADVYALRRLCSHLGCVWFKREIEKREIGKRECGKREKGEKKSRFNGLFGLREREEK